MTTAETVLNVARGQLGYVEDTNGDSKFAEWDGDPEGSWCDFFVSWVGNQAGASSIIGNFGWTPSHVQWFKSRGQWGKTPRVGAVVFFDWNYDGEADHVGLVETVNADGSIGTIEGNSTNPNGGRYGVFRHTEWPRYVLGYGYPAYDAQGNTGVGNPKTYTVKRGDTLWGIAAALGVSLTALLSANPGPAAHPTALQPGATLTVPSGGHVPSQAPTTAPKPVQTPPPKPVPAPPGKPKQPTPTPKPPAPVTSPGHVRVLSYGMSGADVSHIQECLHERGYSQPVTGWFGPITSANVHYFLSLRSWLWNTGGPDATAGPLTQNAICSF